MSQKVENHASNLSFENLAQKTPAHAIKKAVCIISGGLDSATAAFIAKNQGYEIIALHFDYGQKTESKEKECFYQLCQDLGALKSFVLDAHFLSQISHSALTDSKIAVPKGGEIGVGVKAASELPATYVPFRNGIFLSVAGALAQSENAEAIFIGVVEEDSSGYPDCGVDFIKAQQKALNLGCGLEKIKENLSQNCGESEEFDRDEKFSKSQIHPKISIKTPLINLKKSQIIKEAIALKVPISHTWSCYENGELACGECDSCRLRLRGFEELNLKDEIKYKTQI